MGTELIPTTAKSSLLDLFHILCFIPSSTETEFLDVIGTKVLRLHLLAIHSHLYYGFYPTPMHLLEPQV